MTCRGARVGAELSCLTVTWEQVLLPQVLLIHLAYGTVRQNSSYCRRLYFSSVVVLRFTVLTHLFQGHPLSQGWKPFCSPDPAHSQLRGSPGVASLAPLSGVWVLRRVNRKPSHIASPSPLTSGTLTVSDALLLMGRMCSSRVLDWGWKWGVNQWVSGFS